MRRLTALLCSNIVRFILDTRILEALEERFEKICQSNDIKALECLLSETKFDLSYGSYMIFSRVVERGYLEPLIFLLSQPGADKAVSGDFYLSPTVSNTTLVNIAAEMGHLNIVKLLLKYDSVDPGAGKNEAIQTASKKGHLEIVKVLANDNRVDVTACHNYALEQAAAFGRYEVVKYLLTIPKVTAAPADDPQNRDFYLYRTVHAAAARSHLNIVLLVLRNFHLDRNRIIANNPKMQETLTAAFSILANLHQGYEWFKFFRNPEVSKDRILPKEISLNEVGKKLVGTIVSEGFGVRSNNGATYKF